MLDTRQEHRRFRPNFDDRLHGAPLSSRRGCPTSSSTARSGIAVGMATNIPRTTWARAVESIIIWSNTHPDASIKDLRTFIKGPDFPTGAIIYAASTGVLREGARPDRDPGAKPRAKERNRPGKQPRSSSTEFLLPVSPDRVIEQIRTWWAKTRGSAELPERIRQRSIRFVI